MDAVTEQTKEGRDLGYYGVHFAAEEDHLAGYIHIAEPPGDGGLEASEIIAILQKEIGLANIDTEEVQKITDAWNQCELLEEKAYVVSGIPPVEGVDGSIEWHGDFLSESKGIADIADGIQDESDGEVGEGEDEKDAEKEAHKEDVKIDFYSVSHVKVVKQGEVLGTIEKPTEGKNGKDIFGNEIKAKDGKAAHVKVGKNVEVTEDETNIIASCDGQITFLDNKPHVKPVLEIDGDVDYDVGKVNFPGTVIIKGNVQDGFMVHAGADLYVHGLVEAAVVHADGDIFLKGGASGKSKGKITCGGNLSAKHLDNINVVAEGDVDIKAEIVNSTIYTKGSLIVPQGSVIGGEIHAVKGGEAGVLGSEAATLLKLFIGHDFEAEKEIEELNVETKEIAEKMQEIAQFLKEKMYLLQGRGSKLEGAERIKEEVTEKQAQLSTLKERADKIEETKSLLWDRVKDAKHNAVFIIRKHIYPGVMLDIGGERKSWETEYTHGVRVTLNVKTYEIELVGIG